MASRGGQNPSRYHTIFHVQDSVRSAWPLLLKSRIFSSPLTCPHPPLACLLVPHWHASRLLSLASSCLMYFRLLLRLLHNLVLCRASRLDSPTPAMPPLPRLYLRYGLAALLSGPVPYLFPLCSVYYYLPCASNFPFGPSPLVCFNWTGLPLSLCD
jgi:hypothetical protein